MNLPPFDADATCPKCGHDDVLMIYVAAHGYGSIPRCALVRPDKYQEHMDRWCRRCGYGWAQATLERE